MTNFNAIRKEDYIEVIIQTTKLINKIKYEYGNYNDFYFNDYGIPVDLKYASNNVIKLYDKNMYSGKYSLFISYTDNSFEVIHFSLKNEIEEERIKYLNFDQNLIKFLNYSSLNLNRLKDQLIKFVPLIDTNKTNKSIYQLLNNLNIEFKDLNSNYLNYSTNIKNITDLNNHISIEIDISNLNGLFIYGFVILSNLDYPIMSGCIPEPIEINNNYDKLNITFSYIYYNSDIV